MPHIHAVAWIDHQKQETVVHAHEPHQRALDRMV
jgi:hypothetical protein